MDHKYINIEMINDTLKPKIAEYNIDFKTPLLSQEDRPMEWHLSIVRFNIPSSTIPIFVFEDNNYYVTLTYNNNDYTQTVIYSNLSPAYGLKSVYHYQDFIDMINTAYTTAFNALKLANPGAPPTEAPYMTYDASTQLCAITCQQSYENNIKIFMNSELYTFFDNFNVKFYGFNLINKKDFELIIKSYKNNINGSYYVFTQEYPSLYYWNDLRTIIFYTSLPVNFESSPTDINEKAQNANMSPILTDFQPLNTGGGEFRSYLQYQPGIYRYTDITSNETIRRLNMRIYWEDKKGNLRPLFYSPSEIISVKLMFERKKTI